MKRTLLLLISALPLFISAQNVTVIITLHANEGGFHSNMMVTLQDTVSKAKFSSVSDGNGVATIQVPPDAVYDVLIPDYTERKIMHIPNAPGATMRSSMSYSRNMVAEEKAFAMSDAEKSEVDQFASGLADTTWFRGADPFRSYSDTYYTSIELELKDLNNGPLVGETMTLIGRKRRKAFKGTTGADGKITLYLPKGDNYDLSFTYHKNFEFQEVKYSKGTSEITWSFEYIGTKEFLRRKKEEEDRQKAEALAAKNRAEAAYSQNGVAAVFDRNKFQNPLIICDASAGMGYILDDLQGWFAKNEKTYPNAQFVFFNDGDKKNTNQKVIGSTGGLYYTPMLPLDKLTVFIKTIIDKSADSDVPDNYVEALIEGVKMAKQPYSDIILIVDNHATVRDMSLLSQFNKPVHVVVFCSIKGGCDHSFCQPDYLKIAWKTKGTLHINDTDYKDLSKLKNDDLIHIGTGSMKFENGEFFPVN
ncbi:MAG TPA: hypothetical protein VFJ43_04005 [Bacteroidia bacterium]|nr:hypothetical protein [Bacteroidia bacterium]